MQFHEPDDRPRVLVVDDDRSLTRTLADILDIHGYASSTAGSGREGLEMAERDVPVLAVVDLRLPDMDGMEVVSRIHELSELTEVVVLTGNATVESAVAALREHSVDYLLKPVKVEQLLHVVSVANERWQRRLAEGKLRDSDERFRRVVESDMLGIMFWDSTGTVYDANDSFLRMLRRSRAELEAGDIRWTDMTPPEFAGLDKEKIQSLSGSGVIAPYEKEFLTSNGDRVSVLIGAATLKRQQDHGVSFVLDITDRKNAERGMRARARQQTVVASFGQRALAVDDITSLFDSAAALVAETLDLPFACVLERRTDGISLMLCAGTGWEVGSTVVPIDESTQAGYTMLRNEPAILADLQSARDFGLSDLLRGHGIASGITVVIPGEVRSFGVLAAHDTRPRDFTVDDVHFMQAIAHVLGTAIERRRRETALRQTQRLEAVGRLASGISHDFNNMLAAISGYAELIREGLPSGDPMQQDAEEILLATRRAAALTKQLLAFSRQQVIQERTMVLNNVVTEMENMVLRLIGPEVELFKTLSADLWPVKADPSQMQQVVLNLCVNARDAMPDGGQLAIDTTNATYDDAQALANSLDAAGEYVVLSVTDTGMGMDADTRSRIFEPFFTTKAEDKGTGLGLATVYGIVKQSGGEVAVRSKPGQGTRFRIFLPRAPEDESAA
ncbi:MAG: two-component hybrid sensor and regulator [Gemmatimonadetes bacterium]|nr:two-component hybrid sensor and regulator [Gemmatimonadota bacterium]